MMRIKPQKEDKEFHCMSLDDLRRRFDVDFAQGLDSNRAAALLKKHGKNQIKLSYWRLAKAIIVDLFDYLSIMLWVTLILSVISYYPLGTPPQISNLITAFVLFASLIAKALLAALQAYNSIKSLRGSQRAKEGHVHVIRDGMLRLIASADLCLGDVVYLFPSSRVPAVLRLVEVKGLVLDKSVLTGETDYIEATVQKCNIDNKVNCIDATNMAFTNCLVVHGEGAGLVVALCTDSNFGFEQSSLVVTAKATKYAINGGVVEELGRFVLAVLGISVIGVVVYVIVYIAYINPTFSPSGLSTANDVVQILVSGVPFGMPVAVTLGLFIISRDLKRGHILVKDVFAIDSCSSIDVIITDKTGTLTRNHLTVADVMQATKEIDPELCYYDPVVYIGVDMAVRELLGLCHFNKNKFQIGDTIDAALYAFCKQNLKVQGLNSAYKEVDEIVFNSLNKYQVKVLKPVDKELFYTIFGYSKKNDLNRKNLAILMARGAPEILLKKCSYILEPEGDESELDDSNLRMIRDKLLNWSFRGHRVVVLCKMIIDLDNLPYEKKDFSNWFKYMCNNLVFIGMIGFVDPPKQDISQAIKDIRRLGIRVVMATGDYSVTAGSIAKEVGILSDKYDSVHKMRQTGRSRPRRNAILLNGGEIDTLTRDEWTTICRDYIEIILSRSTPQHKLRCVREFQANGYSVLMAGDGANDIPALRAANISVAMGSGNRVAADISDIVLLDNAFTYIPKLVGAGKRTFDSIKKMFLHFTTVSAFSQAIATIISTVIGLPNPYSVYVGTIICVITDAIPALTFIFEKPYENYQKDDEIKSKSREKIVGLRLLIMGCFTRGPITTLFIYVNSIIYVYAYTDHSYSDFVLQYKNQTDTSTVLMIQSISFYSVVCVQSFGNIWAIRSLNVSIFKISPFRGPNKNLSMVISSVAVYLVAIFLVNVPTANYVLGTMPIPWPFYFLPFFYSFLVITINEIRLFLANHFKFKVSEKWFWW